MSAIKPVALVTGGAGGIGRAIAQDLARDHDVAVKWLTSDPGGLPAPIRALRADDLTEEGAAAWVVAEAIARFGRLDVIVNNAGRSALAGGQSGRVRHRRRADGVGRLSAVTVGAFPPDGPGHRLFKGCRRPRLRPKFDP